MSFPDFYNPDRVGELYRPDAAAAITAGSDADVRPADDDDYRIMLLLIDAQVDFIHPEGSLSVPGAVDDTRRTIEWLFEHLGSITTIVSSLDSHVPIQIFSRSWWIDAGGNHPEPMTPIASDDVRAGRWKPLYEPRWSRDYVEKLEEQAKKQLMIWPYHTLIGTSGHNFMPALYEAIAYHTAARQTQPQFIMKGSIPRTEHYSMLEPEVKVPQHPQGSLNTEFLEDLASYDRVYIAGQAKSHCVLETTTSMMRYFQNRPELVGKLYLLTDCTSSVAHPDIDFETIANETYARFEEHGLKLVKSSDPVG